MCPSQPFWSSLRTEKTQGWPRLSRACWCGRQAVLRKPGPPTSGGCSVGRFMPRLAEAPTPRREQRRPVEPQDAELSVSVLHRVWGRAVVGAALWLSAPPSASGNTQWPQRAAPCGWAPGCPAATARVCGCRPRSASGLQTSSGPPVPPACRRGSAPPSHSLRSQGRGRGSAGLSGLEEAASRGPLFLHGLNAAPPHAPGKLLLMPQRPVLSPKPSLILPVSTEPQFM